jgi:hypothetical protein
LPSMSTGWTTTKTKCATKTTTKNGATTTANNGSRMATGNATESTGGLRSPQPNQRRKRKKHRRLAENRRASPHRKLTYRGFTPKRGCGAQWSSTSHQGAARPPLFYSPAPLNLSHKCVTGAKQQKPFGPLHRSPPVQGKGLASQQRVKQSPA